MDLIKKVEEQKSALLKLAKKENKSVSRVKQMITKQEKEIFLQQLLCAKTSTLTPREKQAVYRWIKAQKPKYHFISRNNLKDFIKNIKV